MVIFLIEQVHALDTQRNVLLNRLFASLNSMYENIARHTFLIITEQYVQSKQVLLIAL